MVYYGSLCTQMYDLDKPHAPENELEFYLQYVARKDMKILEPMCGSGRFLIAFLEEGYEVDGFDVSEDMLNACRQKLTERNLTSNLTHTRADEFVTAEKYDLIMTPGGSFVVIKDEEELKNSLQRLHDCLKDDGKFLVETLTPNLETESIPAWKETNRKTREDGKVLVQYSKSFYDEDEKLITYPLKYELLDDGSGRVVETEEMVLYIKLHEKNVFKALLEDAGFVVERMFDGHSNVAATEESKVVIYECRKKKSRV